MSIAQLIRLFILFFQLSKPQFKFLLIDLSFSYFGLIHVRPLDLQYLDEGRHQEALVAWRNATLQKVTHVNAWNNMAILLGNLGKGVFVWNDSVAIVVIFL